MNTKYISLAFAAFAALLAGCAKSPIETPSDTKGLTDLELTHVGSTEVKSVINGTDFPEEGEIGLFLYADEEATVQYGDGFANVKYSYNSAKGRWTASPSIKVGSTPGYLYGYYPYNSESTDVKEIPVTSSLNGDDVMYASKQVEPITDKTASQTAITMNHALARVTITVTNNSYTGKAELSKIKFSGAEIAPEGTLNALDGKITATNSDVTLDVPTANQTITVTGSTYECLLVPSGEDDNKQTVTLTLTIDGEDKTATLSGENGVIIAKGTKSNITISLSNKGISVQTVSVEDWKVVEVGGHKVTVKLADEAGLADDVLTNVKADGSNVIIRALSYAGEHLKCTLPGGGLCPQSKTSNLVYTFTLSDISSDITATIGYAKAVTITKVVTPDGSATIEVTGDCYEGETVTLSANENYDYYSFVEWQDADGEKIGCANPLDIYLTSDLTVKAIFRNNSVLSGVFTVNGSNRKVLFSRGNLFYDGSKYCLEKNQYDVPVTSGSEIENHVGHFYWSSNAGSANSLSKYSDSGKSDDDVFFANHPESFEVNGLKGWSVLKGGSGGEWDYLLNTRKTTYGTGVLSDANHRYAMVKVYGMEGLLIFPDEFSWPDDAGTEPQTFNTTSSDWNNLDYTKTQFEALQTAGCVFLPAAGDRDGASGYPDSAIVNLVGYSGYYWSASPYDDFYAYDLLFFSGLVSPSNDNSRSRAYSVRLVTESK